jgi:uncharacterized protein
MKILTFTDIHEDWKSIEKIRMNTKKYNPTLLICAGDISMFEHQLAKVLEKLNNIGKPILLISGNHENLERLEKECDNYHNIMFIDRKICTFREYIICGYGGGGFAMRGEEFVKYAKVFKRKMKGKKSILVVHQPPYKTKVDYIHNHHAGNKSYTDFIKDVQPNLVICGHLHETAEEKDNIGKTKIINPGWDGGKLIEI